jgi:hypothetical protein
MRIDEIIITQTNERISQELSNVSADELKANVLAGIAPFFALLAVSQNWQFFKLELWYIALPFMATITVLVTSFLIALYIIKPKSRFLLWDPQSSIDEYSKMSEPDAKRKLRDELLTAYRSIEESREKNSKSLKLGYILLMCGSIGALIILLAAEIFGKAFGN